MSKEIFNFGNIGKVDTEKVDIKNQCYLIKFYMVKGFEYFIRFKYGNENKLLCINSQK